MSSDPKLHQRSVFVRYGFFWVALILFVGSTIGHWTFGWRTFAHQQQEHGQQPKFSQYVPEALRDVFENWQSEFLSVVFQIAGLSMLYAVGSPQSRETEERLEHKLDRILKAVDPENGEKEIKKLDRDFARM